MEARVFTGLIDDVGRIESAARSAAGLELRVRCSYADLHSGESIALNGACLTVRECGPGWFVMAAVETTLERTTIGSWRAGREVNLERALRLDDRLGGHFVQGHVDGVARVVEVHDEADVRRVDLGLPQGLSELLVLHGSLAVDGVSLTVNELPAEDIAQVALIDYTLQHTTLGRLARGELVHLEADMIAKHVRRLLASREI
jgi:riboflavin synthase